MKDHKSKLRVDLLPPRTIQEAARVYEHGAKKYTEGDWQQVPVEQHLAAAMRHILELRLGNLLDPDSGLQHADHAAVCCAMAAEILRQENNIGEEDANKS